MDVSIYIPRAICLYLTTLTVLWLVRGAAMREAIHQILHTPGMLQVTGFIALMLGSLIVVAHNTWEFEHNLFITLFGYMTLLKGFMRLGFPHSARRSLIPLTQEKNHWFVLSILLILTTYFALSGFVL